MISIPDGTKAELAVLSSDIQGSTALTEDVRKSLNAALMGFANHDLQELAKPLIVKVDGDGLLLITGNVLALPRIASRLLGIFQLEANKLELKDVKLRMGASYGYLTLVKGANKATDANGNPISRAVRIQTANKEATDFWCDSAVVQALLRENGHFLIRTVGENEIKDYGKLNIYSVEEEVISPAIFREMTCFHQGRAMQYWCYASWLHRSFKNAINEGATPDAIEKQRVALLDYLQQDLQQVALGTFSIINKYFAQRAAEYGKVMPRICLKGFDEDQCLFDLAREKGIQHADPVALNKNSGFAHVVKTGTPFLANDLVTDLVHYSNPRLIRKKVLALDKRLKDKNSSHVIDKQDWIECWENGAKDERSCYRSTLIIPLTLKNNIGLLPEFRNAFGGGKNDDNSRMIYGALCFDHVSPQFFRHEDIDFGYVAADWLSLYLLTQINYTANSTTFKQVAIQ